LPLAMVRHKHTPQNSLYLSDRPEDEQPAQRAGVRFQWAWDWSLTSSFRSSPALTC